MNLIQKGKNLFLFLTVITSFFSCNKGSDIQKEIDPITNIDPVQVEGSVHGKVVDQNGLAVSGANVNSGGRSTTTDSRGFFLFRNILLDRYASVVTVEKSGYFKAIRTFASQEKGSNFVSVKLIAKQLTATISATAGGTITLPNNSSINIPANSVVTKSNNQVYSGSIRVYAAYIDPTNPDIAQRVPGSFMALDSQNKRVVLKSYGMMVVELENTTGQALQIATGKTAKLRMTIPSSLQGSSPATIPLWSMNEATGMWEQEGNAVKTGSGYEGYVSHFSFWNCDFGFDAVFVETLIKSPTGPLQNALVRVTSLVTGAYVYGQTDSAGHIDGFLPKNESLLLEVLNICYQTVYSKNIGPFSQITNLVTITTDASLQFSIEIKGNVVKCNNQPLAQGSVAIYYEGQLYYTPVINGLFSLLTTRCPTTSNLEIVVIDSVGQQQSNPNVFPVSNGTLNTGTLTACGVSTISTMTYTLDGVSYFLSSALGDTLGGYTGLSLGGNGTGFKGVWGYKAGDPNTYLDFEYGGGYSMGTFGMVNFGINNLTTYNYSPPFNVNITTWGNVGQFIEGNFNVEILQAGTTFRRITATFRVRRLD